MNKTKKILIIFAIVFALGDIAWGVYDIVNWFTLPSSDRTVVFYLVFSFIEVAMSIAVVVLLTMAIWGNGKLFKARYGLYMTALMLSLILNLFSLSTIFLIASMFTSNWVWVHEDKVQAAPNVEIINETKEEKIAKLREKKEKGEISQEEFEKQIMDLL